MKTGLILLLLAACVFAQDEQNAVEELLVETLVSETDL